MLRSCGCHTARGACFFGGQIVKVRMLRLLSNPAQGLPTVNGRMNKRILLEKSSDTCLPESKSKTLCSPSLLLGA